MATRRSPTCDENTSLADAQMIFDTPHMLDARSCKIPFFHAHRIVRHAWAFEDGRGPFFFLFPFRPGLMATQLQDVILSHMPYGAQ